MSKYVEYKLVKYLKDNNIDLVYLHKTITEQTDFDTATSIIERARTMKHYSSTKRLLDKYIKK